MDISPAAADATSASRPAAVEFLFIGELARQTGADPKTIRFYERAELISPPRHGRFRTYLASDVQRLKNVLRLRKLGVPIARIRELLATIAPERDVLESPAAPDCLSLHLTSLLAQQAELERQIGATREALDLCRR